MYSEHFTYKGKSNYLLNHTKHMRKDGPKGYRHHHHLHLSGFRSLSGEFSKTINNRRNEEYYITKF